MSAKAWKLPARERGDNHSFTLRNGMRLRATGNNLLVKPDPVPTTTRGGLIIPGDAAEDVYNTGTVVAVGYVNGKKCADKVPIPGIAKGSRIYFIRYLAKQDTNVQISSRLEEDIIRIRPSDVIFMFEDADLSKIRPDLV